MSTTNFGQGHAAQAQEAPVRGSGDGYSLRSRSLDDPGNVILDCSRPMLDASATVGHRRPTPVRVPKGPESLLDPEIEFGHVTANKLMLDKRDCFRPQPKTVTPHTHRQMLIPPKQQLKTLH